MKSTKLFPKRKTNFGGNSKPAQGGNLDWAKMTGWNKHPHVKSKSTQRKGAK